MPRKQEVFACVNGIGGWGCRDEALLEICRTAKNNLPSVGLLNSVGFQLVGTERISFHKDSEGNDIYFEGGNFVKELC